MNANKVILLDFYNETFYSYDLNTKNPTLVNTYTQKANFDGWIAFEECDLFKKKTITTGIFCINDNVFFIWNDDYYEITEKFIFERNTFYFMVWSIKIKINDSIKLYCKKWSKDIDMFSMDDFFYFLEYSSKENFLNIKRNCIAKKDVLGFIALKENKRNNAKKRALLDFVGEFGDGNEEKHQAIKASKYE